MSETQELPKKKMWSTIYHDTTNDKMYLWYVDGTTDVLPVRHRSYTNRLGEFGAVECGMKDIFGNDVYEFYLSHNEEKEIKRQYQGSTNHFNEIDIDPRCRFLQQQYEGYDIEHPNIKDINLCFMDIEVSTEGRFPVPWLAEYPINLIILNFADYSVQFGTLDIDEETLEKYKELNCTYIKCATEQELLTGTFNYIREHNVDILSGWNFSYDTEYTTRRAKKLGIPINLMSRMPKGSEKAYFDEKKRELHIAGTEVMDFLALYKKYTFSEEPSYKLDAIGEKEVGEKKVPLPDGYLSWKTYPSLFGYYNVIDGVLCRKIQTKTKMFDLALMSSAEARVPITSVFESKKMMVGFVLNHLHKQNMVFPVYRPTAKEEYPGAFVYSVPGFYKIEVSYDYRSLYPSIMMTFNISPETKVIKPIDYVLTEEEKKVLIRSPWTHNGQYQVFYRKDVEGIVPQVTRKLFNGRAELKIKKKQAEKDGNEELMNIYDMMQKVYKVLGNSLYGLLGTPFFAFYDIDNAASITGYGQRLIKYTCKHLAEYINHDLSKDQRFINTFGYSPKINPDYCGEIFWNEANVDFDDVEKATEWGYDITGDILQRRMSHGDTDSFYAKFDDIYEEFSKNQGKKVQIVVYDGHQIIHKDDFDAVKDELAYKKHFALMAHTYCPDVYDKPSNREPQEIKGSKYKFSKLQIMYKDGMISNKRFRVIINRYRLTDFCRMLDASILEEKLDEYMLGYASSWGYRTNELFLKREKCIYKTIVTAKKKYICVAESNEDIVYLDKKTPDLVIHPHYAITGLEIVRSSTTMFSRERMMNTVELMMDTMDRETLRKRVVEIKDEYTQKILDHAYLDISCPSGVKEEPPEYTEMINFPKEELKKIDWRRKAASVWNYLILNDKELMKIPYEPIHAGDKMKYIKVCDNPFGITSIGYTGDTVPPRLLQLFTPDWEGHWKVTVSNILGRLFKAVGWGENIEEDQSQDMCDLF